MHPKIFLALVMDSILYIQQTTTIMVSTLVTSIKIIKDYTVIA